jgi:hypothetical protein
MAREFLIHFEPYDSGSRVEAKVFVEALAAIVDGFRSMANALAPAIAQRGSLSRSLVTEALTLAFVAVDKGSLMIGVVPGAAPTGAALETARIAALGWSALAAAMKGAARGQLVISDVPLVAAENFVRAGRVGREANVRISLRSRRSVSARKLSAPWRTNLDLTGIEPALSGYVRRRSESERIQTQLVGQIVALNYSPPGLALLTGKGKISVAIPAKLRTKAQACWGDEAVVLVDASLTADGDVRDAKAIDISRSAVAGAESDGEDESFGMLKGKWDTPESRDYFDNLRGKH